MGIFYLCLFNPKWLFCSTIWLIKTGSINFYYLKLWLLVFYLLVQQIIWVFRLKNNPFVHFIQNDSLFKLIHSWLHDWIYNHIIIYEHLPNQGLIFEAAVSVEEDRLRSAISKFQLSSFRFYKSISTVLRKFVAFCNNFFY